MKKHLLSFFLLFAVILANGQASGYLKEGFETRRFPPKGWSTINKGGPNIWRPTTTLAHEGEASALSSFSDPDPKGINYLITEQFTVTAGDSVVFWFSTLYAGYTDSLYVQVSTTQANPGNFKTTLATFYDGYNYPAPGVWKRVSLSLSDFAGENIYVAFKHIDRQGDGIVIDDVELGTPPAKEIKTISIDEPSMSVLLAGATFAPKATFQNVGSRKQTFNVTFTAGSYTSTKTITNLAPQAITQVTFDDFRLPSSHTTVTMVTYSALKGDVDMTNDTTWKQVSVYTGFANNGWVISHDMPVGVFGNAVTSYYAGISPKDTAYIYSIGGVNSSGSIAGLNFRFDVKHNKWKSLAEMPTPRYGGSAFTWKGKIYYIGGYYDSFAPTDEVSIYDIVRNTWSTGRPVPAMIGDYAACQYQDSMFYIIGGFDGIKDHRSVYIYNAGTDTWSHGTQFPGTAADGNRAGIVGNTIITVGGYSQSKGTLLSESYAGVINPADPKEIRWTKIADYPAGATSRLGATGIKNSSSHLVYFTGGFDSANDAIGKQATWAYDVDTKEWQMGPDKPTGVSNISGFAPFVFGDTVYIASIGGYDGFNIVAANEWLKIDAASIISPVRMPDFTATPDKNRTLLSWKVSEDGTGGYYIIQRAPDGVHFADISSKRDAGHAATMKDYTTYDMMPQKGYNYYRVKAVNNDGSISYSAIKAVQYDGLNASIYAMNIYPNPSTGPVNILLQNNTGNDAKIAITITDAIGRKIVNQTQTLSVSLTLNYRLKPGTYVVNLVSDDGKWKKTQKVIIE